MLRPSLHRRRFALTPPDLAAYSKLLLAQFPGVRFHEWPMEAEKRSKYTSPPKLRYRSSLDECGRYASIVFDPSWTPDWDPPGEFNWWVLHGSPMPNGEAFLSGFLSNADGSQRLQSGEIYFSLHAREQGTRGAHPQGVAPD